MLIPRARPAAHLFEPGHDGRAIGIVGRAAGEERPVVARGLAGTALTIESDGEVAVGFGILGHRAEGPSERLYPVPLVSGADEHHAEIGPRFGASRIERAGFAEGRGRRVRSLPGGPR